MEKAERESERGGGGSEVAGVKERKKAKWSRQPTQRARAMGAGGMNNER